MTRVHVAGASGYAGSEFIRLALRHPGLELGVLESASRAGAPIANHVAALHSLARDFDSPGDLAAQARPGEVAVLAGGADLARELAPPLLERGRASSISPTHFGCTRTPATPSTGFRSATSRNPRREARRESGMLPDGRAARAVATRSLRRRPRADRRRCKERDHRGRPDTRRRRRSSPRSTATFGLTGSTGIATRPKSNKNSPPPASLAPLVFTPHVVPLRRGLLADAYAFFERAPDESDIRASFARAYGGSPFLSLLRNERAPSLLAVAGTNDAELHVTRRGRVVRVIAALDNLGKGAAGQAMQNINLMLGLPEASALDDCALVS